MLLLWILACKDTPLPSDAPACIGDVIADMEAEPVRNPPSSITEYVIDNGQPTPASTWPRRKKRAARATCAPGRGSLHGRPCKP